MFLNASAFWRDRVKASGIHLSLSLGVAALAAVVVFGVWYPYPYREISGGRELFLLLVTVDVILGPLITLTVFNRAKPVTELRRDLSVVVLIQLLALGYGLWTVFVARPVHMVFEYDRFRVVHAVDIPQDMLAQTPGGIDALPLAGPTMLALRPFRSENEKMEATLGALSGLPLAARPDLWVRYQQATADILKEAKPVATLMSKFPSSANDINRTLLDIKRASGEVAYLPLVGRKSFWTVFLDPITAEVLGTMPLDSF